MAKIFIDTEFLEGKQNKTLFGIKYGETKPTIDLISVGLVDMDGREFYAISKDFNLKEAWNRWQPRTGEGDRNNIQPKKYWIRENVLHPIFIELTDIYVSEITKMNRLGVFGTVKNVFEFTYKNFKYLINLYGQTNNQIANDICEFIFGYDSQDLSGLSPLQLARQYEISDKSKNPEFYAFYADYDWCVFCFLFGSMMDLPLGFPKYCKDLKQILDEVVENKDWYYGRDIWSNTRKEGDVELQDNDRPASFEDKLQKMKRHDDYPKQINEHNALADAKFNKELFNFLKK